MKAEISTLGGYNSINEFVEAKLKRFSEMDHNMASLYEMMFSEKENIMYETSVGYEIKKTTYGEARCHIEAKSRLLTGLIADSCSLTASQSTVTSSGKETGSVGRDAIIGLYMGNSLDWLENFWCILRCGYSVLLMNQRLDSETLEGTLRDCGVKAVISDGRSFSVPTIMAKELKSGAAGKGSPAADSVGTAGNVSLSDDGVGATGKGSPAADSVGAAGNVSPAADSVGAAGNVSPAADGVGTAGNVSLSDDGVGATGKGSPAADSVGAAGKGSPAADSVGAAGNVSPAADSVGAANKVSFGTTVYVMSSGTTASVKVCGYTGEEFYHQICDSYSIIQRCELLKKHYNGQLKLLTFLPFYHIFGLVAVYIWFAFFSRTFVELKNLEPETITGTIKKHGVTHIFAVPLFWNRVYEQALKTIKGRGEKIYAKFLKGMRLMYKTANMPGLNRFLARKLFKEVRANMFGESVVFMISGGSEISPEVLRFFNGIGYHLANGYGMSEVGITSVNLDKYSKKLLEGYVGEPFGSIEYKLTEAGNLCVRGKTVASVVFENGAKRSVGREEWFDTRDMATCENGQYKMLGRRDDVVISSTGENLNPNIIEPAFSDIAGVRAVCLIGPRREGAKTPVLVISTDKFITGEQFTQVDKEVRSRASELGLGAELKDLLFTTDELMNSEEFKLNRRKIRSMYEKNSFTRINNQRDGRGAEQLEGNAMALRVRGILAAALDKPEESIGYETDFFIDLGGTSLDYFSMLCELEEAFDVTIPDEVGTSLRTPQKICEYIKSAG